MFKKGNVPWNKGKEFPQMRNNKYRNGLRLSEQHKNKISIALKGGNSTSFKKGATPWNKGVKGVQAGDKHGMYGKKHTAQSLEKMRKAQRERVERGENKLYKDGRCSVEGYKLIYLRNRRARIKHNGGTHTVGEWENLKAQYNWACPCCYKSEPDIKLTADHIIPLCKGGSNNIENIQPLCLGCNVKKMTKIIKYEIK